MGKPITWQNVNGPSLAEAAAPMAAAQRSFDTAFSRLGDELTRRESTNNQNWQTGKDNNTEAFLAEIGKFRTPEELAAAQQSGLLDRMSQGFNGQVDQGAIRKAQDLLPGVLQERVLKAGQYQDAQTTRTQQPLVDEYNAAVARNDTVRAREILDTNQLLNEGPMEQALALANRNKILADRQTTTFANEQALAPLRVEQLTGQIANQKQQTETNRINAESVAEERTARQAAARVEAAAKARLAAETAATKGTSMENGDMRAGTSMAKVQEVFSKLKDVTPQNINEMNEAIQSVAPGGYITMKGPDGKEAKYPVPVNVVIAAVQGAYDSWSPFSDHGDAVKDYIKQAMKSPALQDEIMGVESRKRLLDAGSSGSSNQTPQEQAMLDALIQQRTGGAPQSFGGIPRPK